MNDRRCGAVGSTIGLIVLVSAAALLVKHQEPLVDIDAHKSDISFVPFAQAHGEPLVSFYLPLIGRVQSPRRSTLPGVAGDDGRVISGYIVLPRPLGGVVYPHPVPDWSYVAGSAESAVIPIMYPADPTRTSETLTVFDGKGREVESVPIKAAFKPHALPARIGTRLVRGRDLTISMRLAAAGRGGFLYAEVRLDGTGEISFSEMQPANELQEQLSHRGPEMLPVTWLLPARISLSGRLEVDGLVTHRRGNIKEMVSLK